MKPSEKELADTDWKSIYPVGAIAAILAVFVGLLEIAISFLPGGERISPELITVSDWFAHFQVNPLMELRNLGLINIFLNAFSILIFFTLYVAHRRAKPGLAALSMIVAFTGAAVFFATNRSFAMFALSNQYAAAAGEAQRAALIAAGESMLAVGQSHTPGTFLAFALSEIASILMAIAMLRGKVFSRATAIVGMLGFALLFIFEILSSFVPALFDAAMLFAMGGGLLSLAWYILVARRLFQLAK
jgi:hypothetical protein